MECISFIFTVQYFGDTKYIGKMRLKYEIHQELPLELV